MRIIGSKFCGHDSALCLIDTDTKEIFAVSTKRVTRIRHDYLDITPILKAYNFARVDYVAHSNSDFANKDNDDELTAQMVYKQKVEKALRKIIKPKYIKNLDMTRNDKDLMVLKALFKDTDTVLEYFIAKIKKGLTINTPENNKQVFTSYILKSFQQYGLNPVGIGFYDHHLCHALPAYYLSPFCKEEAIVVTLNGLGEGYFSKCYLFNNEKEYKIIGSSPAEVLSNGKVVSLGKLYRYFTEAMELSANNDEYIIEARSAYADAHDETFTDLKDATMIDTESLSIRFDMDSIDRFCDFDWLQRQRLNVGDDEFCAVIQQYIEDTVVSYLKAIYDRYKIKNLCLSGGVMSNALMNLHIYQRTPFENIYVLPPTGDDGLAIGSAIAKALELGEDVTFLKDYSMPYFGDSYTREYVQKVIEATENIIYEEIPNWQYELAKSVSENKICAVFNGKMEFGMRTLGNRSILALPRLKETKDKINATITNHEAFIPLTISVIEEQREMLFEKSYNNKHATVAFIMKKEYAKELPSAVHIDNTARVQFVQECDNKDYYQYLKHLQELTGYGVSINIPFNLSGRTIVRTPKDAIFDFLDSSIDELYIEGFRVIKDKKC